MDISVHYLTKSHIVQLSKLSIAGICLGQCSCHLPQKVLICHLFSPEVLGIENSEQIKFSE